MTATEPRLKIAVQKNGRLTARSLDLLERCGLTFTQSKDQLFCYGENLPVDLLLVRDDDIPALVSEDVCDLGIVGLNTVHEKRLAMTREDREPRLDVVYPLGFGHCRLAIAVPEEAPFEGLQALQGKRIATSYPDTLGEFLARESIEAAIVHFSGAVEIAPKLGRSEFVCDLVSTGATLAANQLREVLTVLESEAVIVRTRTALCPVKQQWVDRILQRLDGVLQVRESKYIMLHAPRARLAEITRLLPGSEAPTIIPLDGRSDKVAVHAVCRENVFWETLENLKEAGASSLLVLPVEKMLA
jgi:ATP phosphoribosyltransferase